MFRLRSSAAAITTVVALAALTMIGTVAGSAVPASAHAELISSDPESGAVLDQAPESVTLTFEEDLRPEGRALVVTAPDDARVDRRSTLTVDGPVMRVTLDPLTAAGVYRVAYRVVSADGHPVSGEYTFTYRGPGGSSPSTSGPAAASVTADPGTSPAAADTSSGSGDSGARWLLAAGVVAMLALVVTVVVRRGRRA
jgi:copper resistance protein C